MDLKFNRIYPVILFTILIISLILSLAGIIYNFIDPGYSMYIMNLGVLMLYIAPFASISSTLIKGLYNKDYTLTGLSILLLIIIGLNIVELRLSSL